MGSHHPSNGALTVNNILYFGSNGALNGTGSITAQNLQVNNSGIVTQSAGTVNAETLTLRTTTGNATYTLTGGRLNIGTGGIVAGNAAGTKTLDFGAGTIGASSNWSSPLAINLTNADTGTAFDTLDAVDGVTGRIITLSGNLDGIGKLVKTGTGTLILSGTDNTYSGGTLVNGGTLLVNSTSGSGAMEVSNTGTLGGTGTIAGAVTIDSGGVLSPGNSTGTLTFADSVTINAGGQVVIEIDTDNALFDILNFVGTNKDLIFDSGAELLVVNLGADSLIGNYQIITGGATLSGLENLIISGDTGYNYALDASGLLSITAIPEPSTYALFGSLGLLGLAVWRQRK